MRFLSPLMGVNFRPAETRELVKDADTFESYELYLEADPNNEYDPNAVKVLGSVNMEEHFFGFIAKEVAPDVAEALASGADYIVEVVGWLGTIKPHLEIVFDDQ